MALVRLPWVLKYMKGNLVADFYATLNQAKFDFELKLR